MKKINLLVILAVLSCLLLPASQLNAQCSNHRMTPPMMNYPVTNHPVYSQPIPVQPVYGQPVYGQPAVIHSQHVPGTVVHRTNNPAASNVGAMDRARQFTANAKRHFLNGNYSAAHTELEKVCKLAPKESAAFQFRSLAAFAQGNSKLAAADAYDSLKLGNAWDRKVVVALYGGNESLYQQHLDALKNQTSKQDATMQSHFLLAYHLLMAKNWVEGRSQLQKVLELQPAEPLSTQLLAVVNQQTAQAKSR